MAEPRSPKAGPIDPFVSPAVNPAVQAATPAKEPELTAQQRLEAFLIVMTQQYRHSGPITPAHLKELNEIVALGRGDGKAVPVPQHEFSKPSLIAESPDKVLVVHTAEEALVIVRKQSDEDRKLPHWTAAEVALLASIDTGERLDAAQAAFDAAVTEHRRLHPVDVPELERLPDGRVREDRFADRRVPEPVKEPAPAPVA